MTTAQHTASDDKHPRHYEGRERWIRILYVILFAIIYQVSEVVLGVVVLVQCGFVLITGNRNEKLQAFGKNIGSYIYAVIKYLTFNTDDKPFPFAEFPQ